MMKKKTKSKTRPAARSKSKRRVLKSAATGKFVSKKFAKKHPRSTYWERLANGK